MKVTSTTPLSTATPKSAMKPTPAEMLNGIPRTHKARMPPVTAKGIPVKTISACLSELKVVKSSRKISAKVIGTTIISRARPLCRCS